MRRRESSGQPLVAEESRELEVFGWAVALSADLPRLCGGGESGLERARRSLGIAEQSDNPSNRVLAYVTLGEAYLAEGQAAAARDATRESVALARGHGVTKQIIPWSLAVLAETALVLGDSNDAVGWPQRSVTQRQPRVCCARPCTFDRAIGAIGHANRLAKELGARLVDSGSYAGLLLPS